MYKHVSRMYFELVLSVFNDTAFFTQSMPANPANIGTQLKILAPDSDLFSCPSSRIAIVDRGCVICLSRNSLLLLVQMVLQR